MKHLTGCIFHTNWPLTLHQLRGDINKIHSGCVQRVADLPRGVTLHGVRRVVLTTLGWHLRMKVHLNLSVSFIFLISEMFALVNYVPSPSPSAVWGELHKSDTFQWSQEHHTAQTGFNWTALIIFWDHVDFDCLFTSKEYLYNFWCLFFFSLLRMIFHSNQLIFK